MPFTFCVVEFVSNFPRLPVPLASPTALSIKPPSVRDGLLLSYPHAKGEGKSRLFPVPPSQFPRDEKRNPFVANVASVPLYHASCDIFPDAKNPG